MMFILLCLSKFTFVIFTVLSTCVSLCEAVTCNNDPGIANGTIASSCSIASFGDECNITCNDGYYVNGNGTAICQDADSTNATNEDGEWIIQDTTCEAVICNTDPTITNGSLADNCGVNFGDSCDITCDEGYYVNGTGTANCDDADPTNDNNTDGTWNSQGTTCIAVTCNTDLTITNGSLADNCDVTFGDTCDVTCDKGYYVNGTGAAICDDADPTNDNNTDGTWNSQGTCIAVSCSTAPTITNGTLADNCDVTFGDTCDITCDNGYYVNGTATAICDDADPTNDNNTDGTWNSQGTTCIAVECETDPGISNGALESNCIVGSFGDTCDITCDYGYYVVGGGTAICEDADPTDYTNTDGTWNSEGTTCTAITCDTSPNVTNGIIADGCHIGSSLDATCAITCNDGYYISGDGEVKCVDIPGSNDLKTVAEWNYGGTMCTAITCNTPSNVPNGNIASECDSGGSLNATCAITCNSGYYISGDEVVKCVDIPGSNDSNTVGEWNYGGTMCTVITCETPSNVPNGNIASECESGGSLNETCEITCDIGYYINGTEEVMCIDTSPADDANSVGEWNYGGTACTAITCDTYPSVSNGTIGEGCDIGSSLDATCAITCNDGYYISGDGEVKCVDIPGSNDSNTAGEWNYGGTMCTAITCNTPSNVPNGNIASECESGGSLNETCEITCDNGYYINGTEEVTCIDTSGPDDTNRVGEWNYGSTACTAITCDTSPSVLNGIIGGGCDIGSSLDATCPITCNDGYYVSGDEEVTCVDKTGSDDTNSEGEWDYGGTNCTAYMVLDVEPQSSAVKGMDANLTVQIQSSSRDLPLNISVSVFSSPSDTLNGSALELYSYDSTNGIFTYGISIMNASEEDGGNYQFTSTSLSSDPDRYPDITSNGMQYLYVQVIPENLELSINGTKIYDDITYVRGDPNNTVKCFAYGNPEPKYQWSKSDGLALSGGVSTNGDRLYLENADFSDNGTYLCKASNNVSDSYDRNVYTILYIEVEGIPVITSDEQNLTMNDDFNLLCSMDANPIPSTVLWSADWKEYDYDNNAFANKSDIHNWANGSYFQYQNQLSLYSQLCVGNQTVRCNSSNIIGHSESSTTYKLNEGAYDLDQDSMTYITYPSENFTKEEADTACGLSFGHLVYITNESLQMSLDSKTDYEYYIGAVRDSDGEWTWGENGTSVLYDNFNHTIASNGSSSNESCAVSSNHGWRAVECDEKFRYICQLPASGFPKDLQANTEQCISDQIQISWEAADDRFKTTTHQVTFKKMNSTEDNGDEDSVDMTYPFSFTYEDAEPDTQYQIKVYAAVDVCLPLYTPMVMVHATTGFGTPKEVEIVQMSNIENNDLCFLQWRYDTTFQWQIGSYRVEVTETVESTGDSTIYENLCTPGAATECTFEMQPNSRYSANITAVSSCNVSGKAVPTTDEQICKTNVAAPEELVLNDPSQPVSSAVDARNGFTISVPGPDQRNGLITCMFVYVTIDDSEAESNSRTPNNNSLSADNREAIVYATKDIAGGFEFTVGADQSPSSCTPNPVSRRKRNTGGSSPVTAVNIILDPNKFYRYYLKSTTPNGTSHYIIQSSDISIIIVTNYYAWIAAIVVPLFLIGVGIAFYFWYKRRQTPENNKNNTPYETKNQGYNPNEEDPEDNIYDEPSEVNRIRPPPPNLLHSRDLKQTYEHKCRDDFRLLRDEFKKVKDAARQLDDNFIEAKGYRGLNRFVNILPAKDHRVRITPSQENTQGFINASYIAGYKQDKKFIATQGPKPNTIADFWQMIWEHNVEAIVMLTNVDENGKRKCEKYWPETSETSVHGSIEIIGKEQSECGPIIVRKFSIKDKKAKTARDVTQYHYVSWPDHGVPLTTSDLFNLRRIVNLECRGRNPIVVHCSAGVGRTGTFISLDYNLDDLATTSSVDITSQMWAMRERRTEMIQTSDQFILVHKMILERHLMGETDIDVARLEELMSNNGLSDDHLETEFEKISKVKPTETDQDISSRFYHLNRDPSVIPYDRNIAAIRMRPEDHTAPYLNASFIPGYSKEDKFIVTQDPLPDTEELFWRMALDNNVSCVVMIRKRGESQDISAKYWADRQSVEFGKVTVSVLETFMERNFTQRKIFLREVVLTSARSSNITHFEFTEWPENPAQGADPLLELIGRVQKERAAADAGHGPVIVHCGNGSEYVGALCAIANIVERIKNESRVDVVRAVKDLRDMRPQMVYSLDEYKVCYAAVRSYLDTFNTYANFQ